MKAAGARFTRPRKVEAGDSRWATSRYVAWALSVRYPVADQAAAAAVYERMVRGEFATYASAPEWAAATRALTALKGDK
jgi:hypothetical protein